MADNKPKILLPWQESEQVQRALLEWIMTYPELPAAISFESLPENGPGLCLSTIQAAHRLKSYIAGGYLAQYQFNLIYRIQPTDDEDQLAAVELLNRIGAWAEQKETKPNLPDRASVRQIVRTNNAAIFAAYEDGSRDYQIAMTMTWEVI